LWSSQSTRRFEATDFPPEAFGSGRWRRPGLLDERLVLRVAGQEQVEAGGEDTLFGRAGHRVRKREPGRLELLEEGGGHRDVDAGLGGGEWLDAEGRGRQENQRLRALDRGPVESTKFACRTSTGGCGRNRLDDGREGPDGRDGDHGPGRRPRIRGQLGDDRLRLQSRAVEEAGKHVGAVRRGDDLGERGHGREA
jgi:hypothetical protein